MCARCWPLLVRFSSLLGEDILFRAKKAKIWCQHSFNKRLQSTANLLSEVLPWVFMWWKFTSCSSAVVVTLLACLYPRSQWVHLLQGLPLSLTHCIYIFFPPRCSLFCNVVTLFHHWALLLCHLVHFRWADQLDSFFLPPSLNAKKKVALFSTKWLT